MNKIQTVFVRDWDNDPSRVLDQVEPGCEWVVEGFGTPLRKYDGTCVMYDGEQWWARREVKDGKEPPPGFMSTGHDHITLKNVGWEPIEGSPWAKFLTEATAHRTEWNQGTYELIGPKINKNPEGAAKHMLIQHEASEALGLIKRGYNDIKEFLSQIDVEGIVFRHPDGRMAKIKKRDFGLRR